MRWHARSRLITLVAVLGLVTALLAWRWVEYAPLRRAHAAYSQSNWWESLVACRSFLYAHPQNNEAKRLAAQAATRLGMFQEADRYFTQSGGLLPDELRTHGEVLIKLRDWDRAYVNFQAVVERAPQDITAQMQLVALSVQRGRYNQAVEQARAALKLAAGTPHDPHCEYLLGSALFARGDLSESATHYIRALELQGQGSAQLQVSSDSLRMEIVDQLLSVSRIDEAREQYGLLPKDEPLDVEQLYQLGRLRVFDDDPDAARKAWEGVLARRPAHFGALLNLGKLMLDQGHAEQGRELLQRATEARDTSAAYFLLAQACSQVEDHDAAERAMKRFRELSAQEEEEKQEMLMVRGSPDHRDTQMILAKRAKRTGDHQLARMFLRRALKIDPDFQPARNMLAEIEKPR